jgi:hypothetical protein
VGGLLEGDRAAVDLAGWGASVVDGRVEPYAVGFEAVQRLPVVVGGLDPKDHSGGPVHGEFGPADTVPEQVRDDEVGGLGAQHGGHREAFPAGDDGGAGDLEAADAGEQGRGQHRGEQARRTQATARRGLGSALITPRESTCRTPPSAPTTSKSRPPSSAGLSTRTARRDVAVTDSVDSSIPVRSSACGAPGGPPAGRASEERRGRPFRDGLQAVPVLPLADIDLEGRPAGLTGMQQLQQFGQHPSTIRRIRSLRLRPWR